MLETEGLLDADYVEAGKVRYIVHPFHLGSPEVALATEAAWCAADQGRFFEYQHILYENQGAPLNQGALTNLARQVDLNGDSFAACLANGTHRADVAQAQRAAANRGVNSTPTFFINNRQVRGNLPYPELRSIIDQELAATQ